MCVILVLSERNISFVAHSAHTRKVLPPKKFSWQRGTVEQRERSYAIDAVAAPALGAAITERSTRSHGGMPYMFASYKQQITERK